MLQGVRRWGYTWKKTVLGVGQQGDTDSWAYFLILSFTAEDLRPPLSALGTLESAKEAEEKGQLTAPRIDKERVQKHTHTHQSIFFLGKPHSACG